MQNKAQAIVRFIISLLIVGGVTAGLIWANCNDKKPSYNTVKEEEEQCAGGPAETEHGTIMKWGEDSLYPEKGEMVTFEGYVEMPNMTYLNGGTYMVNLVEDSLLEGRDVVMQINEGDCENTMVPLPDDYDNSDLVIRDNSGNKIRHGEKVRVTGKVTDDRALYMFWVKRIEKQ